MKHLVVPAVLYFPQPACLRSDSGHYQRFVGIGSIFRLIWPFRLNLFKSRFQAYS